MYCAFFACTIHRVLRARVVRVAGDFASELDLSVFLPAFRARKKGTKITGKKLLKLSRTDLLALPGCAGFEDETDMLLAVVEGFKVRFRLDTFSLHCRYSLTHSTLAGAILFKPNLPHLSRIYFCQAKWH